MLSTRIKSTASLWNSLNGILNVYKPPGVSVSRVRNSILNNICKDLNQIDDRVPQHRVTIEIGNCENYLVERTVDLADHVLSVGPRYLINDVKCIASLPLGIHTSGVLVLGLNEGTRQAVKLAENRPIRAYHVKGELGVATENHFTDSRITAKATFRHVSSGHLSSLVSSLQASHQRKMYELCGVDLQSQAAYELAIKGLIRPNNNHMPLIYGIKIIEFTKPHFMLEIHAINENENYFASLINEIGIEMRTVARCTSIQCIRQGFFKIEDALLHRQWVLSEIRSNIKQCHKVLKNHSKILRRKTADLVQL